MLNKIMLIGNLGKDPDMSYTPGGKAVTKFSLAVTRRTGSGDERKEETTWFNVVMWERLAETANTYLHKGSKVFIEGRMTSREFTDKEGVKRTFWDVVATEMELLTPKSAESASSGSHDAPAPYDDVLPF